MRPYSQPPNSINQKPVWGHLLALMCSLAPFACIGLGGISESKIVNYITALSNVHCMADNPGMLPAEGSPLPSAGPGIGPHELGRDKPICAI